ncbi:MAG: hypothetical protein Q9173_001242 [Seirophora scorigena]
MFSFFKPKLLPQYSNIPYTPLAPLEQHPPSRRRRLLYQLFKFLSLLLLTAAIIITSCLLYTPKLSPLEQLSAPIPVIPRDFRMVGLVFYGRRSRVEILDCYLKDLAFLDELVANTPAYTRRDIGGRKATYGQAWAVAEKGAMYIKIDDDIEHLFTSTNTINSPRLALLHAHLSSAIHPFLPSSFSPSTSSSRQNWRPSLLPTYPLSNTSTRPPRLPRHPSPRSYPQGYSWLSLPAPCNTSLKGTPMELLLHDHALGYEEGYRNWAVGAQQHMSFLRNLEEDGLWRYGFDAAATSERWGKGRGKVIWGPGGERRGDQGEEGERGGTTWDMRGARIQINMIAIWGDDVVDNAPVPDDDEWYLGVELVASLLWGGGFSTWMGNEDLTMDFEVRWWI